MATLNASQHVFMITFHFGMSNNKFIFNEPKDLKDIIEKHDKGGIESIKIFNPVKAKFERVNKKFIQDWANYDTEVDVFLSNHYYFKK